MRNPQSCVKIETTKSIFKSMSHNNLFKINTNKNFFVSISKPSFKQDNKYNNIKRNENSTNPYIKNSKSLNILNISKPTSRKPSNSPTETCDEKIKYDYNQSPLSQNTYKQEPRRYRSKALEFILNNRNEYNSFPLNNSSI